MLEAMSSESSQTVSESAVAQSQQKKKIFDERVMLIFFIICWVAYFSSYLGRLNFSAAITEITSLGVLTKSQAGLVGTAYFCSYGAGQILSGILGDKLSSRNMVFMGLVGSSVTNVLMGLSSSAYIMTALWLLNGAAQSLTWSPIVKIFADRLPRRQCLKACINISTSVAAGTLGAYLMTAVCIAAMGWRSAFFVGAFLMTTVAVIWLISITKIENHAQQKGFIEEPEESSESEEYGESIAAKQSVLKIIMTSGMIIFIIAVIMMGILKDGVTTWTPSYISETFNLGSVLSILTTTLLPVINLTGVYAASFLNSKVFKDELLTAASLFVVTVVALLLLILLGDLNVIFSAMMLAVTTSAMLGINTMIIGVLPLYFARANKVSTITGILNATAYIGSAVSTYGIGALSEYAGWGITIGAWCAICIVGALTCVFARKFWNVYKRKL